MGRSCGRPSRKGLKGEDLGARGELAPCGLKLLAETCTSQRAVNGVYPD